MIGALEQPRASRLRPLRPLWPLMQAGGLILAAMVAAASLFVLGLWALIFAAYAMVVLGVLFYPRRVALALVAAVVVIEPGAIDFTSPLSRALYEMPPDLARVLPLTATPVELMLVAVAASLLVRPAPRADHPVRLPLLTWAIPVVMATGAAYGLMRGGASNLAYIEARGLLYGGVAFFVALRMRTTPASTMLKLVLFSSTALSTVLLLRYFFYVRPGKLNVAFEFTYAHEDVLFLSIAFVIAAALLLRTRSAPARMALVAHELLVVGATAATGRRAGTLVFLVAALVLVWLLLPKRPALVVAVSAVTLLVGVLYLGTYWNQSYGALAQPARALRSQFEPTARDESSDTYRVVETYDVVQTIAASPTFGVGFGRPFIQFRPLPVLPWWPMQFHTPHNNLLWLWLKTGVLGVSAFLGVWMIALARSLRAFRYAAGATAVPLLPLAIAAGLIVYMAYAGLDLALISTRAIFPLAAALALAFTLPAGGAEAER